MTHRFPTPLAAVLLLTALAAPAARAAESYDGCSNYITALPTVISTQGVWCMKTDLATSMASGAAITIGTNNVTIDCNHFKLGGLSAGLGTATIGIKATGRANTGVRRCNVRGFLVGVQATSLDGGHVIEDNRFDSITGAAIWVEGDGSMVRRNQVLNTGGTTQGWATRAINALGSVQILDNQIQGVTWGALDKSNIYGVFLGLSTGGGVAGNSIGGLFNGQEGFEIGIQVFESPGVVVRGNDIVGLLTKAGRGIACDTSTTIVRDNSIIGMDMPIFTCPDVTGNHSP